MTDLALDPRADFSRTGFFIFLLDICENGGSKPLSAPVTSRSVLLISVVLHLFVRSYVAVSKAKFAQNVHFVLSGPD